MCACRQGGNISSPLEQKEFGWGYALWNFAGDFGIVGHGRPGTVYEEIGGYQVDRALLDILLESRVGG